MDVAFDSIAVRIRMQALRYLTNVSPTTKGDVESRPTSHQRKLQERDFRNMSDRHARDDKVSRPYPRDELKKCPDCKGSGKCRWCKGVGKRRDHIRLGSIGCTYCRGSGMCKRCGESSI
jgi:hypothetical protein